MSPQFISLAFSLTAVLCWGISDFAGGYASRKSDAFLVTLLAHTAGFSLMLALTVLNHAPIPTRTSQLWAMAAGALGGLGLALFYGALASGRMGLTAPVAAVLGAAIPAAFGIAVQGVPGTLTIAGFLLAGLGIWLISLPDGHASPEGFWMAVLSGLGFAGFFICISRAGDASALWSATYSRFASVAIVAAIVLVRRGAPKVAGSDIALAVIAGCLDSTGTLVFIRSEQTGRLDAAVVLASLYPAITVLLARIILKEQFSRWKVIGILAALAAVPLIALQ
jgi:drug/metabolite transporter (DMT)-like permease